MHYLNKIQTIIIITTLVLASCAKPIDFDVNDDEKKIVMNGLISPDSTIKVNLSKSLGVLELEGSIDFIEDAEVKLFENNIFIENLSHSENGYYNSSVIPQQGIEYKVSANIGKLSEAIGTTILPEPIEISDFEYTYDTATFYEEVYDPETQQYFDTSYLIIENLNSTITFSDPLEEDNYYFLTFTARKKNYVYLPPHYFPEYIGIEMQTVGFDMGSNMNWENYFEINEYINGYIFSDELFNGNSHTINAEVYNWGDGVEPKVYVNLYTIKKELYNFALSLSKYEEARYNPLTEPVNVISNIEGGYGFFSGYSVSLDSMIFEID